ncbi:GntR family transcriptional regulator [Ilumatobacter coccineus]|jgi:DNA-binding GntR family transcriptional regulator|uniref:Putative GntR family transcriptional regulator n=1 Tax=Ilumatobacter coccineus (strain NBRC 103263 / KCTC 29153 / YM16-304) TaxID=1313172 RepID=A0A6C7EIE8_ILUCY|nr:GntR family transcriptional regulator [Ilumatobacter coccineus]BAN04308.1 putative GntR family transcriptional regulator [Ilumatobacter coccineus YM16-304]
MKDNRDITSAVLRLWRGALASGLGMPSEAELAEQAGASRPAVREVLIRMEEDGLIVRRHGSGTYPNPAALEVPTRLDKAADFADRLAAAGYESRVEVMRADVLVVDPDDVPRFATTEPIRLLRTTKRWWADDAVAVVAVDQVPLAPNVSDDEATARAADAMTVLAESIGRGTADWMFTWPAAAVLDAETAELLQRSDGDAVLRIENLGVDRRDRRVFHALEYHCPGIVEYGLIHTLQ